MSTFTTTKISITDAAMLVRTVYLPSGGAVLLQGPAGCGKSAIMRALQRRLQAAVADMGACFFNCANAMSVDMVGWPKMTSSPLSINGVPTWMHPVHDVGLRGAFPQLCPEHLRHEKAPDEFVPADELRSSQLKPYKYGIAVFDEVTTVADETILLPLAQFFDEGRVGQWGVPAATWARVGLTNRSQDNAGVRDLHAHTRNRLAVFEVYMSYGDVAAYWEAEGMNEMFRFFAASEAGMVFSETVPVGQAQFCTGRSWEYAYKDMMKYCKNVMKLPSVAPKSKPYDPGVLPIRPTDPDSAPEEAKHAHLLYAALAARCGEAVAIKFQDFVVNFRERPDMAEILTDPTGARLPAHAGVLYAVVEMLTHHLRFPEFEAAFRYMKRMPKPLCSSLVVKLAQKHGPTIAANRHFMELMTFAGAGARTAMYLQAN